MNCNTHANYSFALKPGWLLLFAFAKKVSKNACHLPSAFETYHHPIKGRTNLANNRASI